MAWVASLNSSDDLSVRVASIEEAEDEADLSGVVFVLPVALLVVPVTELVTVHLCELSLLVFQLHFKDRQAFKSNCPGLLLK